MLKYCENVSSRQFSATEQARALAVILEDEFAVSFTLYDAATGTKLCGPEGNLATAQELEPAAVSRLAAQARASLEGPHDGAYQAALVLNLPGAQILVAVAALDALAHGGSATIREQQRLKHWLWSVEKRLQMSDQLAARSRLENELQDQVKAAWKTTLTVDHLVRHLRFHKPSSKTQQRILEAAYDLLGAQTLVWVPQHADAPVLLVGEPCLAQPDCRCLAGLVAHKPDLPRSGPLFSNPAPGQSWRARFPHLTSLMAFAVTDRKVIGWVLALDKKAPAAHSSRSSGDVLRTPGQPPFFDNGDAALLAPFVSLLQLHARTANRHQDLQDLVVGLARSLTAALDAKDSYTFGHSERVARIAVELAREMGMGDEVNDIYLAGLLHDVGKIGIRDTVLGKKEPLTDEEMEHIKQHVTIGHSILEELHQIRNLLPGVLHHHERYDGKSYPHGLAGQNIPLLARILAVADAYDAMTTTRPYRTGMPGPRVEAILTAGAGAQWDQQVIEAFLRCKDKIHAIRQRGVGESLRHALDGAMRQYEENSVVEPLASTRPSRCP